MNMNTENAIKGSERFKSFDNAGFLVRHPIRTRTKAWQRFSQRAVIKLYGSRITD
jgi:hypothetical protein